MSGPGTGGAGLGVGVGGTGSGLGCGSGSGVGTGGTGSVGVGGVGSGRGVGGSGSIGGMTMDLPYPRRGPGNRYGTAGRRRYGRAVLSPEVRAYYECGEEDTRLSAGGGRLEWARTWELLERHLPPPPAVLLDVGGGPGAYAVPLALAGYEVHLVDAMPLHVEQAGRAAETAAAPLASAVVGDARALPAPDATADAVLLLGPLYHLLETAERAAALAEARRVLRPGGVLVGVAISRFASLYDGLRQGWAADHPGIVESGLHTGTHRNPEALPGRFTTAHFARPDELAAEVTGAGFELAALVAVEGPGSWLPEVDDWLDDPGRRDWLLRTIRRVEAEPSLLGASAHVLAVGQAPEPTARRRG